MATASWIMLSFLEDAGEDVGEDAGEDVGEDAGEGVSCRIAECRGSLSEKTCKLMNSSLSLGILFIYQPPPLSKEQRPTLPEAIYSSL